MNIVILGAGSAGLIAALMVREKYPLANITIVKSGEIGIVGVGEGSTEHWARFMDFIGLDVIEMLYETSATVKIGILFKGWSDGPDYVHSISSEFLLSAINRPEIYNHFHLNSDGRKFPLSPYFESVFSKNLVTNTTNFRPSNQFHFDTFKLGQYLSKKCTDRNITIIDRIVSDVILDTNGDVLELVSDSGNISGDLFIDCSGFRRVLSTKLNNKWVRKTDYLPLNRAIAFPTAFDDLENIEPYTTATALSSGWSWKIPTQERYGNGYVFNTNYIDSDNALAELSKVLGKNVEKFARDIPFEAGKVDKFWLKNVISVGLSGSFAEPLEAQSIGFTIVQCEELLNCLDVWPYNKKISDRFNIKMDAIFDNVIDYLQLHYLGNRNDTKFWQDKPFKITDFLNDNLKLFKRGIFEQSLFNNKFMFNVPNFYQVAAGLDLIDKNILRKNLESNRVSYNNFHYGSAEAARINADNVGVLSHRQFIEITRNNYLYKKSKNEN